MVTAASRLSAILERTFAAKDEDFGPRRTPQVVSTTLADARIQASGATSSSDQYAFPLAGRTLLLSVASHAACKLEVAFGGGAGSGPDWVPLVPGSVLRPVGGKAFRAVYLRRVTGTPSTALPLYLIADAEEPGDAAVDAGRFPQVSSAGSAQSLLVITGDDTAEHLGVGGNQGELGVAGLSAGTHVPVAVDAAGDVKCVGPTAVGAAPTGAPVLVAGSDGNTRTLATDAIGRPVIVGGAAAGAAPAGAPVPVAGKDAVGNVQFIAVDTTGHPQVAGAAGEGAAVAGNPVLMAGQSPTGTAKAFRTDADGLASVVARYSPLVAIGAALRAGLGVADAGGPDLDGAVFVASTALAVGGKESLEVGARFANAAGVSCKVRPVCYDAAGALMGVGPELLLTESAVATTAGGPYHATTAATDTRGATTIKLLLTAAPAVGNVDLFAWVH